MVFPLRLVHSDRRVAERVPVRVGAELARGGRAVPASTRNLSMTGVCIESAAPGAARLVEGETVQLTLFLVSDDVEDASAPQLTVRAEVMWTSEDEPGQPSLAGLRFEPLNRAQQDVLTSFFAGVERSRRPAPPPPPPRRRR